MLSHKLFEGLKRLEHLTSFDGNNTSCVGFNFSCILIKSSEFLFYFLLLGVYLSDQINLENKKKTPSLRNVF